MKRATIQSPGRDGITLMEVLIAIGILAVGLSSVAALLPAGGSQAKKAVMADRASSLATNALADAITTGLTRPAVLFDPLLAGPPTAARVVIDPLGDPGLTGMTYATFKTGGVFGGGAVVSGSVRNLFGQSRDDIIFNDPVTEDALPTNLLIDGTRGFLGRTSCLWVIEKTDGSSNPLQAGDLARLSIVLFHERDIASPSAMALSGTVDDSGVITVTLPSGRLLKNVFRPGTVVLRNTPNNNRAPSLYVLRAAPAATASSVYTITDDSRLNAPTGTTENVTILLDSVGLAQQFVTLEGNSEYALPAARRMTP